MSAVTYYCGDSQIVKTTLDQGATWNNRSVPLIGPASNFMDIKAWPGQPDKVTVVGTNGAIWTSSDQGLTWFNASPFMGNIQYAFEEVWHVDSTTSYAVGQRFVLGLPTPIFCKSVDGGATYTSVGNIVDTGLNVIFQYAQIICVHFADANNGVIGVQGISNNIGGYPPSTGVDQVWVLRTTDGGTTWTVTNALSPIDLTLAQGTKPWGIKITPNGGPYIINLVVDAPQNFGAGPSVLYRSVNNGTTYTSIALPSPGVHLTWLSTGTNIWVNFAATNGGAARGITFSSNEGASFTTQQTGLVSDPFAGHFYMDSVLFGYYSSGSDLYFTIDGGATGTLVDSLPGGQTIWAVWSELVEECPFIVTPCVCPPACYTLHDCSGILPDIQVVEPDRPAPIGSTLVYDEYPGTCWEITAVGFCDSPLDIQPVSGAENCECCLPPDPPEPEPQVRYPYVITKTFHRITVSECDIKANQIFGESVYDQVKKLRFGIQTNCPIDPDNAWINKELSDLASIYNEDLCVVEIPNPCCVEEVECVYPQPLSCSLATDVTVRAEFTCIEPDLINSFGSFT